MNYKNIEKKEYKSSFEVSLDQDSIAKIIDEKINEKQPTFEIAGFRKGKVPINIIKSKIGPQIENEVLNDEISKNISEISEKEKIESLIQPDVQFKDSYNFSLSFFLKPEIKLEELKSSEIEKISAEVTKKDIDDFCDTKLELDWDTLRKNIQEKGLRNSTLTALMPCESSSQISNSTNGIEPPRGFISVKQSKDGILKQVVPEYEKLHKKYELLWDIKDNEGYLQLCAIMQKFVDQSISTNTHYDPSQYDGNRVPMKLFLMDLLKAYKYGIKTLYYHTTRDGASDDQSVEKKGDDDCEDGVCKL